MDKRDFFAGMALSTMQLTDPDEVLSMFGDTEPQGVLKARKAYKWADYMVAASVAKTDE